MAITRVVLFLDEDTARKLVEIAKYKRTSTSKVVGEMVKKGDSFWHANRKKKIDNENLTLFGGCEVNP